MSKSVVIDGKSYPVQVLPYIPPEEHDITWPEHRPRPRLGDPFASTFDYIQTKLDHQEAL